ncbi:hypothetical protein X963_6180 [Burkholderia pseudomallei MSHR7498]|nr:hypothetical protein X963_6180 [Burkholderia pseudomallei MSHR7498]
MDDVAVLRLVLADRMAVDVLADVLRDVTDRRAFRPVDHLEAHTMALRTWLVAGIAQAVLAHDGAESFDLVGKYQAVPMRRTVVIWLGNAHPEIDDAFALQLGTSPLPYLAQICLRRARIDIVIARVRANPTVRRRDRVKSARAGQCEHDAPKLRVVGKLFKPAQTREQLAALHRLV